MVVRQSQEAVRYDTSLRPDNVVALTSVPAGVVAPISFAPLFRGDSATGRIDIDAQLAEMPKPLDNAVLMRAQAWFVPRPSLPQFLGVDDYMHAYHGKSATRLGNAAVAAVDLFDTTSVSATYATANSYEILKTLGVTVEASETINNDLADVYVHIHNFRKAAHSSKLTNDDYASENATAWELKPAFWPRHAFANVVADYESALVTGSLELDVVAGSIPVMGVAVEGTTNSRAGSKQVDESTATLETFATTRAVDTDADGFPDIYAEMAGVTVGTTLADIEKARATNAFAKIRSSMQGSDYSGFNNDDVIVADLMQGFNVPPTAFNRPWLLDSKTVVFGMNERHATDAANLDDSVTIGNARVSLSINIPRADYGGVMMATVEVLPERIYPRQSDEYLKVTTADDLPEALRDSLTKEPVSQVLNGRIDTAHTTPAGVFGYEPMNAKWKRDSHRLGGLFQSLTPGAHVTSARTAIWQPEITDPGLTADHWLAPHPFPQDVFSVPSEDCCIVSVRQGLTIRGITQFGDDLVEDNSEFADTLAEQP